MNLPIVVQQEARHGEDRPKNCFFKVHLDSLNNDEMLVLLRGRVRLVTMDYNAICATLLA